MAASTSARPPKATNIVAPNFHARRDGSTSVSSGVGFLALFGVSVQTGVILVEYINQLRSRGHTIQHAAREGSILRFRPILMTSFAFILGIWPLVNASGAGAASRRSLGTAVFGGMIAATVLAVFFVPIFYVLMQRLSEWRHKPAARQEAVEAIAVDHAAPELAGAGHAS